MDPCICVTNRHLCQGDFLGRIRTIAGAGMASAIMLREKDLSETEYAKLAEKVLLICGENGLPCILHSYYRVAQELSCPQIHLPESILNRVGREEIERGRPFSQISTSVHSLEQTSRAIEWGADLLVAGHIFATDCKRGMAGRGTDWLGEICHYAKERGQIPVYAIGGIHEENQRAVMETGAAGVCRMSGFMA